MIPALKTTQNIKAEILEAQLEALIRVAGELDLNDARDWLIEKTQRNSGIVEIDANAVESL